MFESVAAVQVADPAVLAGALFALTDDEIADLPVGVAEAVVLAAQRVVSAVTARQSAAVETVARRCDERAELDAADVFAAGVVGGGRRQGWSGHAVAAGSLAALLHVSPRTMSARIARARRVVCALPGVQALAWAGDLEPYRVDAVVAESAAAPSERLHEFEARVLEGGISQTSCAALRRRARRAADRCAPDDATHRARLARARSDVRVRPGECIGMTRLVADLPTPVAMRIWGAVDGLAGEYARANPGLRMGAARVDALSDLIAARATISTTIELVAPIDSGHASRPDLGVSAGCLDEPSDLESPEPGGGYVDPGGCEELDDGVLHDHDGDLWFVSCHTEVPLLGSLLPADVVGLLHDPDVTLRLARSDSVTGATRWQDPRTYRPGARTARAVRSRDGTCRFPGCATAAGRCQLDHVIRHPDGPTTVTNLQALCATHHGFKHHAGWQVEMDALGVCTWTAPDGRTHTTRPLDRHGHQAA
ncbi:HNH endonuclease signature motif containing protein [Pedococcus bigeumensis]|uniref:HNH endonuclease signature motif containing protein n=1 Tax=Pedococcus bigeumensis TaxID=433644 RepID=UPI002FEB5B13